MSFRRIDKPQQPADPALPDWFVLQQLSQLETQVGRASDQVFSSTNTSQYPDDSVDHAILHAAFYVAKKTPTYTLGFVAKELKPALPGTAATFKAVGTAASVALKVIEQTQFYGKETASAIEDALVETAVEKIICIIPGMKVILIVSDVAEITDSLLRTISGYNGSTTLYILQMPRKGVKAVAKGVQCVYKSEEFRSSIAITAFNPIGIAMARRYADSLPQPKPPAKANDRMPQDNEDRPVLSYQTWTLPGNSYFFDRHFSIGPSGPMPPVQFPIAPISTERSGQRILESSTPAQMPSPIKPHPLYTHVNFGLSNDRNLVFEIRVKIPIPLFVPSIDPWSITVNIGIAVFDAISYMWQKSKKKAAQKFQEKLTGKVNECSTAKQDYEASFKAYNDFNSSPPPHDADPRVILAWLIRRETLAIDAASKAEIFKSKCLTVYAYSNDDKRKELLDQGVINSAIKDQLKEISRPSKENVSKLGETVIPQLTAIQAAATEDRRAYEADLTQSVCRFELSSAYKEFHALDQQLRDQFFSRPAMTSQELEALAPQLLKYRQLQKSIGQNTALLAQEESSPEEAIILLGGGSLEYLSARLRFEKASAENGNSLIAASSDVQIRYHDTLFLSLPSDEQLQHIGVWKQAALLADPPPLVREVYAERSLASATQSILNNDFQRAAAVIQDWAETAPAIGLPRNLEAVAKMATIYAIAVCDPSVATPLTALHYLGRCAALLSEKDRALVQPYIDYIKQKALEMRASAFERIMQEPVIEHGARVAEMHRLATAPAATVSEMSEVSRANYTSFAYLYVWRLADSKDFTSCAAAVQKWLASLTGVHAPAATAQDIVDMSTIYLYAMQEGNPENPLAVLDVLKEIQSAADPKDAVSIGQAAANLNLAIGRKVDELRTTYREANFLGELFEFATAGSEIPAVQIANFAATMALHPQIFRRLVLPLIGLEYQQKKLLEQLEEEHPDDALSYASLAAKAMPYVHQVIRGNVSRKEHPWIRDMVATTASVASFAQKGFFVHTLYRELFVSSDFTFAGMAIGVLNGFSLAAGPIESLLTEAPIEDRAIWRTLQSPRFSRTLTLAGMIRRYGDLPVKRMGLNKDQADLANTVTGVAFAVFLAWQGFAAYEESCQALALEALEMELDRGHFANARSALADAINNGLSQALLYQQYISCFERFALAEQDQRRAVLDLQQEAEGLLGQFEQAGLLQPASRLRYKLIESLICKKQFGKAEEQIERLNHPQAHVMRAKICLEGSPKRIDLAIGHYRKACTGYEALKDLLYEQEAPHDEIDAQLVRLREGIQELEKFSQSCEETGQIVELNAKNQIPQELEYDPLLSLQRCSLSGKPIRHIVFDPEEDCYYEKSAILSWLEENQNVSPISGRPLDPERLEDVPEIQESINDRLQELGYVL